MNERSAGGSSRTTTSYGSSGYNNELGGGDDPYHDYVDDGREGEERDGDEKEVEDWTLFGFSAAGSDSSLPLNKEDDEDGGKGLESEEKQDREEEDIEEEDTCPICLQEFHDRSVLENCFRRQTTRERIKLRANMPSRDNFLFTQHLTSSFSWGSSSTESPIDRLHRYRTTRVPLSARSANRRRAPIRNNASDSIRKLVPWIRRELRAILYDENVEIVKDYIVAVMQKFDLQSDMAISLLTDFLDNKAELFVHELLCFARSPFDIDAYDVAVQYDEALPGMHTPRQVAIRILVSDSVKNMVITEEHILEF
ncbi:hypothetical protein HK102_013775 [Quaeritorhiza haematococci]|nr:hypothetical protein HK102_013775 [Quaeritorhiza haematococci]